MKKEANTLLLKLKVVEQFFKLKIKIFSFAVNFIHHDINCTKCAKFCSIYKIHFLYTPSHFAKKHERNKTVLQKRT